MSTTSMGQGTPSLAHIIAETQQVMGALVVLGAKQDMSAALIADQQTATSTTYKTDTEKEISDSNKLSIASAAITGVTSMTSGLAGMSHFGGMPALLMMVKDVVSPIAEVGSQAAQAVFSEKLGEDQKTQISASGLVNMKGDSTSDLLDGSSDLIQKAQGLLSSLASMINNEKQASGA